MTFCSANMVLTKIILNIIIARPTYRPSRTDFMFCVCAFLYQNSLAMHCNLRPPDVEPVVLRLNYETHISKFEVGQPIRS